MLFSSEWNPTSTGRRIAFLPKSPMPKTCIFSLASPKRCSVFVRQQTRAEKGQREGLPRELEVFGRCCKALYPEVKKERMDEIEHLPSFPANLSYTRGQWKIHLVRFGRSTHARLLIHVGLWGWKGGWIPVERNELSPPRNTAKSVESSWKARRSLLPSHEYTSQP